RCVREMRARRPGGATMWGGKGGRGRGRRGGPAPPAKGLFSPRVKGLLPLFSPVSETAPPLCRCPCCQRRFRGLHPPPERTELLSQDWGIVWMHKACGGLQQFAVPHGGQVCATTRDLAVAAAALRLRWFPHPPDPREIVPPDFPL